MRNFEPSHIPSHILLEGASIGMRAYKLGLPPIAACDQTLLNLIQGIPLRESVPITEHWLLGWYRAKQESDRLSKKIDCRFKVDRVISAKAERFTIRQRVFGLEDEI